MTTTMMSPTRTETTHALRVEGLSHYYGEHLAVDDLSFEVRAGEFFALLGSNGAGKTTTLEIVQGLRPVTHGHVSVLGADVTDAGWRSKVGVMLQDDALAAELTVKESLRLFGRLSGRRDSVDDRLAMVGLDDKAKVLVRQLSGGERRSLEFAIASWGSPDLMFLDEPTAGLDAAARAHLWDVVDQMARRGTTFVLTTHYLEEAERFADRIAILHEGRMVASGTLDELTSGQSSTIACSSGGRVGGIPFDHEADGEAITLQSDSVQSDLHRLLTWADAKRIDLGRIEVRPASLEHVFLALTDSPTRPDTTTTTTTTSTTTTRNEDHR